MIDPPAECLSLAVCLSLTARVGAQVSQSIDRMSAKTLDEVDDEFIDVVKSAKELDFTGPAAEKVYAT